MRNVTEIIIHCTATRADWWKSKSSQAKVNEVRRWHKDKSWSDIGYHYLIDRDGTVVDGRPVEKVGAHVKGHNTGTIGVSLFGGFSSNENDKFSDHYTPEQETALRDLLNKLKRKYPSITKASGHNEYAAKACPGFNVREWLFDKKPRSIVKSTTLQATVGTAVAGATGAGTAIAALDDTAQLIIIAAACVAGLLLLYIARERIRKWAKGER